MPRHGENPARDQFERADGATSPWPAGKSAADIVVPYFGDTIGIECEQRTNNAHSGTLVPRRTTPVRSTRQHPMPHRQKSAPTTPSSPLIGVSPCRLGRRVRKKVAIDQRSERGIGHLTFVALTLQPLLLACSTAALPDDLLGGSDSIFVDGQSQGLSTQDGTGTSGASNTTDNVDSGASAASTPTHSTASEVADGDEVDSNPSTTDSSSSETSNSDITDSSSETGTTEAESSTSETSDTTTETASSSSTSTSTTTSTSSTSSTSGDATTAADSSSDDSGEDGGDICDPKNDDFCHCDAVDLLIVVDSRDLAFYHRQAFAGALSDFFAAVIENMPDDVDYRIGVTTAEMGMTSVFESANCRAPDASMHYVTIEDGDTGRPACQGRLLSHQGVERQAFNTSDGVPGTRAAETWLAGALGAIAPGSLAQMPTAAAGWATHPDQRPGNRNFFRDAGAVLGTFIAMGPGDDSTPDEVTGQSMFEMMAARKTECGGARCMTGGGVLDTECFNGDPVGQFLDAMALPPPLGSNQAVMGTDPTVYIETLQLFARRVADICWGIPPSELPDTTG